MNKVILYGRICRDIELKSTPKGMVITEFPIAVQRPDGTKNSDFITCTFFGQKAETLNKYCKKGDTLIVEGSIRVDNYTKKDGTKASSTKVLVSAFHFCGNRKGNAESTPVAPPNPGIFADITPEGNTPVTPFPDFASIEPNGVDELPFG